MAKEEGGVEIVWMRVIPAEIQRWVRDLCICVDRVEPFLQSPDAALSASIDYLGSSRSNPLSNRPLRCLRHFTLSDVDFLISQPRSSLRPGVSLCSNPPYSLPSTSTPALYSLPFLAGFGSPGGWISVVPSCRPSSNSRQSLPTPTIPLPPRAPIEDVSSSLAIPSFAAACCSVIRFQFPTSPALVRPLSTPNRLSVSSRPRRCPPSQLDSAAFARRQLTQASDPHSAHQRPHSSAAFDLRFGADPKPFRTHSAADLEGENAALEGDGMPCRRVQRFERSAGSFQLRSWR